MFDKNADFPKVTVILRGYTYEQCRCVVEQLVGTKLNAVEVAFNTPGAAGIIERLNEEFGSEVKIGAGTVTTEERAVAAVKAGAHFMLSPINFSDRIFEIAKDAGVVTVPAAFSPSETVEMFDKGADIVKVFPAGILGPKYFSDVRAASGWTCRSWPLAALTAATSRSSSMPAALPLGVGSGIFDKQDIREMNSSALADQITEFEKRVRW